jgi:hypothetical protein
MAGVSRHGQERRVARGQGLDRERWLADCPSWRSQAMRWAHRGEPDDMLARLKAAAYRAPADRLRTGCFGCPPTTMRRSWLA